MRHRGDKVVLGLFHPRKLGGHLVQRAAQLTDLVVVVGVQADAVLAAGDFFGELVDVQHRRDDGPEEKAVGKNHQNRDDEKGQRRQQVDLPQLGVQQLQGGNAPHRADQLATAVIDRRGGGHDLFLGKAVIPGIGVRLTAGHGPLDLVSLRNEARRQAAGGEHHLARFIEDLHLHPVRQAEILHQIAAVFVKLAVAGAEIAVEVFGSGVRLGLQPGLHRGIEIGSGEHGHQHRRHKQYQQHHAHIVDEPAPPDASVQAQAGHQAFFRFFCLVFRHDVPPFPDRFFYENDIRVQARLLPAPHSGSRRNLFYTNYPRITIAPHRCDVLGPGGVRLRKADLFCGNPGNFIDFSGKARKILRPHPQPRRFRAVKRPRQIPASYPSHL